MIRARFDLQLGDFRLHAPLELPGSGVTAIFGRSGCGKTTLLRCIAGLEPAARGHLEVGGQVWQDDARALFRPAHERALGYVFQDARLFPHLDVRGNLAYGQSRTPAAERRASWDQAVHGLGLEALLARMPEHLSGGERRRVAIARALLAGPRLLLLDEPLAGLDQAAKRQILDGLERLARALDLPVLYVSHEVEEIARIADHLVLLAQGRVLGSGPLGQMLARLDLPTARDEDAGVIVDTVAGAHDEAFGLTRLDFAGGQIQVPHAGIHPGQRVRLRIRARDVSLTLSAPADTSILNRVPATIEDFGAADHPANVIVRLDAAGTPLLACITRRSCAHLRLETGAAVWAQVKAVALVT
jgi:molybdate transport system ATP-binding protein